MMPKRDPDPEDPNVLVGVALPGDLDSVREMASAFADEFAALGFDEKRLLNLFRLPGYQAAHQAYRALGEVEIRRIIGESLSVWSHYRVVVEDAPQAPETPARGLVQPASRAAIAIPSRSPASGQLAVKQRGK